MIDTALGLDSSSEPANFYILVCTVMEADMAIDFFDIGEDNISNIGSNGEVVILEVNEQHKESIDLSELDEIGAALEAAEEQMSTRQDLDSDPAGFLVGAAKDGSESFKSFERKDVLEEFKKDAAKEGPQEEKGA